ncbi:MAG: CRISPR-associated endoribonuclease Cas6 [Anaerolineae bacterium]
MSGEGNAGLYAVVLLLGAAGPGTARRTAGHLAHASVLQMVREVDGDLSARLHARESVRPFTVSTLEGVRWSDKSEGRLEPGDDCWLRVTAMESGVFQALMARLQGAGGRSDMWLGPAQLLVREALVTPGSHPWAGYTTWQQLLDGARPAAELTLQFASPTAFGFGQKSWGKKCVVLPDPELVFGSLLRIWRALSPLPLAVEAEALQGYLQDDVVVARFEGLRTQMLRYTKAPQIGFVGRVTFGLKGADEGCRRALNALADFAFYAGVGMKTAMGMGQCRRLPDGA